jgi:signal transduction histidine kinase
MLAFIGEKSNLQHNIVTVLSENLHHELKTPLAVISEEIKVIEESLNSSSGILPYYSIIDAVNIIKVNTDIVFSIIETIRITKFINHSYTNSNIYGIVRYAVKMMNITNKEKIFSLEIEEGLKLYELRDLSLYNLLIILINHIKNAIEAGSTDILFHCPGTCSNDGCLTFFIIDNGRGIADNIVDKIYNLNFSTKEKLNIEDLPSRGIGLYLSRELLRQSGGDERLFSTSNSGTTFEIKIPVYEKKT